MGIEIKGPWDILETHKSKHRRMHDSLIELLSDYQDASKDQELPRIDSGELAWQAIPISVLIQFSMTNINDPDHDHREKKDIYI